MVSSYAHRRGGIVNGTDHERPGGRPAQRAAAPELALEIWANLERDRPAVLLTEMQRAELARWDAQLDAEPGPALTWQQIRASVESRRRACPWSSTRRCATRLTRATAGMSSFLMHRFGQQQRSVRTTLVNLVVRPDRLQQDSVGTFVLDELEDDPQVIADGTRPSTRQLALQLMCFQRRLEGILCQRF